MSADEKSSPLPENADKVLFAEDIVNHVLSELELPLLSSGITNHRALVYNAFGPEARLAASYAKDCGEEETEEDFARFLKYNTVDIRHFLKYVTFLKGLVGEFVPTKAKSQDFLTFCVRISMMAVKFYNHGIQDAPTLAVDHIVSMIEEIDMVEDGGWKALNEASTGWAQFYVDVNKVYLTPERDVGSDSLDNSPDREENADEDLDVSTDEEFRKVFIDSGSSSPEEPVSLSSSCRRIDETCVEKPGSIMTSLDNATDSMTAGSSEVKNSGVSFNSSLDTSKKVYIAIQNEKPSCSYSTESKFDTKKSNTDVQVANDVDPTSTQSAVECSQANELNKLQHLNIPNYDNLNNKSVDNSSTNGVQTPVAKSGRRKKSVPKRRDAFASKR